MTGHSCQAPRYSQTSGRCYFIPSGQQRSRQQAAKACEAERGKLADLDDAQDRQWLPNVLKLPPDFWVGATQLASSASPQQGWSWQNGKPVEPSQWRSGQPDDRSGTSVGGGSENHYADCGMIRKSGGEVLLSDESCAKQLEFLCERRRGK